MKKLRPKEPGLGSLIFTASSGILLGALLGLSVLLTKPVKVVAKQPDESVLAEPGDYTAYFMLGTGSGLETPEMRNAVARIARRTPGPVAFSESELNYYLAQASKREKTQEKADEAPEANTKIEQLNVRIEGDQMYASMKVILNPKGDRFEMLLQANIDFQNTEEGPELVVQSLRLNSMPVPDVGGVFGSMIESRIAEAEWPEEHVEIWENIRNIEIESGSLIAEVGLKRPTQ